MINDPKFTTFLNKIVSMKKMGLSQQESDKINYLKYQKNGFIGVFTRKHISTKISWFLSRSRLKPDHITFFAFFLCIVGVYFLSTGEPNKLILAGFLIFLSKIFDAVDGELARFKQMETSRGAWLDGISDRFKENLIFFGVAVGLYNQTGNVIIWYWAFIAVISIHMLSTVLEDTGKMDKKILEKTHKKVLIVRILNKLGIKSQYIALQADSYLFITYILIIFNQLQLILWFFMIVMNFYWLAIVFFIYRSKRGKSC